MQCADDELVPVDPTNDNWDGNWDGCFNRGSFIVRCPYPYIPCGEMWSSPFTFQDEYGNEIERNRRDFKCGKNCGDKKDKRRTCNRG